jgi:hypothetical protein
VGPPGAQVGHAVRIQHAVAENFDPDRADAFADQGVQHGLDALLPQGFAGNEDLARSALIGMLVSTTSRTCHPAEDGRRVAVTASSSKASNSSGAISANLSRASAIVWLRHWRRYLANGIIGWQG